MQKLQVKVGFPLIHTLTTKSREMKTTDMRVHSRSRAHNLNAKKTTSPWHSGSTVTSGILRANVKEADDKLVAMTAVSFLQQPRSHSSVTVEQRMYTAEPLLKMDL